MKATLLKYRLQTKSMLHALALITLAIWLIGFFGYGADGAFHFFLGFSLVTVLLLIGRKKKHSKTDRDDSLGNQKFNSLNMHINK